MKFKKLLIHGISMFLMISGSCPVMAETSDPANADETPVVQYEGDQEEIQEVAEEPRMTRQSARTDEKLINLYGIGSDYEELVTLPEGYPSSWQIPSDSYRIIDDKNDCLSISASGLVTPKMKTWYFSGSFWTTTYIEGAATRTEVNTGTATIQVNNGGSAETYTVNVVDYAYDVYPDMVLDSLIEQYIPENPTQYEVLEGATKIAASFDYSVSASNWKSMILQNGGDCWASTSLIMKLCSDYGIEAKNRNANRDPGAGSGHRNVLARIGSQYYIADAGFSGEAPRYYSVEPSEPFSYRFSSSSNSYVIYQYDGFENEIKFPSMRGSYPVTELDANLFSNGVTKVILPASIQSVRPMQLEGTNILFGSFSSDADLVEISVDPANETYCDIDGVLFTKDRKTLVQFPAGRTGTYTIPEGTETIGPGAFCKSKLDTVNVPASVKTVSDFSFIDTAIKKIFFKGERPLFGDYCFYRSTLTVESENPWEDMDSFDFGSGDVTYVCGALLKQISNASISGISSEYEWTGNPVQPEPAVTYEGTVLSKDTDYTLTYQNNTNPGTGQVIVTGIGKYTGEKTVSFQIVRPALRQISNASISGVNPQYSWTGLPIQPDPVVRYENETLVKGIDYTLSYQGNINPGTGQITVSGIGEYTGEKTVTFQIVKQSLIPVFNASISGLMNEYEWTGQTIEPEPVLRYENTLLVKDRDYVLSYEDNINPGMAYVIVSGIGDYSGSMSLSFRIAEPVINYISMHRLYNPNSGEHFYTGADKEKDFLILQGWQYEGEGWKAPMTSNNPVYRLYNPNAGDHHYTLDYRERNRLILLGWKNEGVGWYSDDLETVPLYREYNPNAKTGSHNYTPNETEHKFLISAGWNDEGIAWYGLR